MSEVTQPACILLFGPTASGKTELAMRIADEFPVNLISVDSVLVYRDMNIGSAKPSPEELAQYPHGLIDIRNPNESFSVADFVHLARQEMQSSHEAGRIPLLVGGTMMYFRALLEGLADMPPSRPEVRQAIESEAEQQGWPAMHRQLQEVDPDTARQLHPEHSQRICRALEVWRISGQPMSQLVRQPGPLSRPLGKDWRVLQMGLSFAQRSQLHERIDQRFQLMLERGLIEEVQALLQKYELTEQHASMRAVGYRQVRDYLEQGFSRQELLERGQAASRQLAKRQLTWMRGWDDWQTFPVAPDACNNSNFTTTALHWLQRALS